MSVNFLKEYIETLLDTAGNDHRDNYDSRRYGPAQPIHRAPVSILLQRLMAKVRMLRKRVAAAKLETGIRLIQSSIAEFQWLHETLADRESQDLLIKLLAYRALGGRSVRLPLSTPAYWATIDSLERLAKNSDSMDADFNDWKLSELDLSSFGRPVNLFTTPKAAATMFILEQYRCRTAEGNIQAEAGDVIIDGGGCWGDTALYFADQAGPDGKVFSFEFLPRHLEIFRRNLALNQNIGGRITPVEHALWSSSGRELFIKSNGPGTQVSATPSGSDEQMVTTLTIDDLITQNSLTRLDFIKMDIEGAEQEALRGAENSLRRFKPRLAITVYHSLQDFWAIPKYLDSLNLGYRFYLRHFTIHSEETVLFAKAISPS